MQRTQPIAIISDTQKTSWAEKFFLRREENDSERSSLIASLAKENPSLVIHLGDACFSPSKKNLEEFSNVLKPISQLRCKKILIPGNHDYSLFRRLGPPLSLPGFETFNDWRMIIQNSTALVFLNSNQRKLGKRKWLGQKNWYEQTIAQLEKNQSVKAIIVFAHHPPFTNSSATDDEKHVQNNFSQPFFASSKARAFFSGHVHAYERFNKRDKMFFVVGGGGGPRVNLNANRHVDSFKSPAPRPFHYALISETGSTLEVEIKGFNKGERIAKSIDVVNFAL